MKIDRMILTALVCFHAFFFTTACSDKQPVTATREKSGREAMLASLSTGARKKFTSANLSPLGDVPVPKNNPITTEKVELGKILFFDPRLSGDGKTSCGTCHIPEKAWADGKAICVGSGGKRCLRNTPTIINVAYYQKFFWDNRSNSLEDQALKMLSMPEMGSSPERAVKTLSGIAGYKPLFQAAFGSDEITADRIANAIATFERTVVSRDSPFDKFMEGDLNALTDKQKAGLDLFLNRGNCTECHRGRFLTNHDVAKSPLYEPNDPGVYTATKREYDRGKFKVPTVRDIDLTAPYMHHGYEATLDSVVFFTLEGHSRRKMKELQQTLLRQKFNDEERGAIVEFLKSLTGTLPTIAPPHELPK
jgi:cytochrome c peroxidase